MLALSNDNRRNSNKTLGYKATEEDYDLRNTNEATEENDDLVNSNEATSRVVLAVKAKDNDDLGNSNKAIKENDDPGNTCAGYPACDNVEENPQNNQVVISSMMIAPLDLDQEISINKTMLELDKPISDSSAAKEENSYVSAGTNWIDLVNDEPTVGREHLSRSNRNEGHPVYEKTIMQRALEEIQKELGIKKNYRRVRINTRGILKAQGPGFREAIITTRGTTVYPSDIRVMEDGSEYYLEEIKDEDEDVFENHGKSPWHRREHKRR